MYFSYYISYLFIAGLPMFFQCHRAVAPLKAGGVGVPSVQPSKCAGHSWPPTGYGQVRWATGT